jgi:hypothetical protein
MIEDDLTQKIIGCSYKVHNALGPGFLERSTRTLCESNSKSGISVKQQELIMFSFGTLWASTGRIFGLRID